MRILFILDSVENPTSANVLMAQRLAGVLCAAGHTVHLLELWDGLHPQPELPGCTVHCLAFADGVGNHQLPGAVAQSVPYHVKRPALTPFAQDKHHAYFIYTG